jgi:signal peptidase II
MKRSPALLFGVAAAGVALDQWTKWWATNNLAFHEPIRVVGDLVRFTYTRNSGIAFGMFAGQSFPFYIFSIVAAVAVVWLWVRHPHLPRLRQWSLALILGGAIGNLIDRLRFGEVTDFILLSWRGHEFPVFNVADMCVTCGVILFALVWTHEPHAPQAVAPADAALSGPPAAAEPPLREEVHGSHAGAGGAGYGSGRPLGPVAGEGSDRGPLT